eukprot:UN02545
MNFIFCKLKKHEFHLRRLKNMDLIFAVFFFTRDFVWVEISPKVECDLLDAEMKVLYSRKYATDYGGEYGYLQKK